VVMNSILTNTLPIPSLKNNPPHRFSATLSQSTKLYTHPLSPSTYKGLHTPRERIFFVYVIIPYIS
jgi:hypothetical protein